MKKPCYEESACNCPAQPLPAGAPETPSGGDCPSPLPTPDYEDIVRYCAENGLIGRLDTVRFYDFYAGYHFRYKGKPVDWRAKAREWASRPENRPEFQTAREAAIPAALPRKRILYMSGEQTDDPRRYLTWLAQQFNIPVSFT